MLNRIEKKIGYLLSPDEKQKLGKISQRLNKSAYESEEEYINDIVKLWKPQKIIYKEKKQNLEFDEFLGVKSLPELKKLINPNLKYEKNYIFFDSFNALEDGSNGIFKWNFTNFGNIGDGLVSMIGYAKNLVKMKLYQPMMSAPKNIVLDKDYSRISILFENFKAQSFRSNTGRRFHYLLRPVQNLFNAPDNSYNLRAESESQMEFIFTNPITNINGFEITLGDPENILTFYPSKIYATFEKVGTTIYINFEEEGNFTTTVNAFTEIFTKDFTTLDPTNDTEIISRFNNSSSPIKTTYSTATQLTYEYEGSCTIDPELRIYVWIIPNRTAFAMELTFLKE